MTVAQLILVTDPSDAIDAGRMVVEQIDFVPEADQIIVDPTTGARYRVVKELPEIRHIKLGPSVPAKWMSMVKVILAEEVSSVVG